MGPTERSGSEKEGNAAIGGPGVTETWHLRGILVILLQNAVCGTGFAEINVGGPVTCGG